VFAVGTETRGSIISPSAENGVTGLRPTYGRVSRHGAMALSWTMDKIGPMCRSVEDCALVFNAIYGPDTQDETAADAPFLWNPDVPLSRLRIGYLKTEFETVPAAFGGGRGGAGGAARSGAPADAGRGAGGNASPEAQQRQRTAWLKIFNDVLDVYRKAGATLQPIEIPTNITSLANTIGFILTTEGAAAFDDLTRSKDIGDPSLGAWPNAFRTHRFVPAVEYIRAQRARTLLIRDMEAFMSQYDAFLSPTQSSSLGLTNLTGHPAVALKAGFIDGRPVELMVTGRLYDEATLLRVALAYERGTDWHLKNPTL
jgi:Asp-tRNA(Asn)/Glu-tRNA(Gln) amidotransferase A subunit family amidase